MINRGKKNHCANVRMSTLRRKINLHIQKKKRKQTNFNGMFYSKLFLLEFELLLLLLVEFHVKRSS